MSGRAARCAELSSEEISPVVNRPLFAPDACRHGGACIVNLPVTSSRFHPLNNKSPRPVKGVYEKMLGSGI
jgi:hypothetical protein